MTNVGFYSFHKESDEKAMSKQDRCGSFLSPGGVGREPCAARALFERCTRRDCLE